MEVHGLLDIFPIWALFLFNIFVILLSIKTGHFLARRQKTGSGEVKETTSTAMVGSILGLLTFIMVFTFGFAAARFEDRKQVFLAETNAIRTCYLRAGLQPEPIPTDSRNLLREYIDVRLQGAQTGKTDEAIAKSQELHDRLWLQAAAAAEKGKGPINGLFITSVSDVIDLSAKRITVGLRNRVPGVIWLVLYSLMIFAMVAMGYQSGLASAGFSFVALPLVFAFSAVLVLIADLDRPGEGMLRVNQQALIDLKNSVSNPNPRQQ